VIIFAVKQSLKHIHAGAGERRRPSGQTAVDRTSGVCVFVVKQMHEKNATTSIFRILPRSANFAAKVARLGSTNGRKTAFLLFSFLCQSDPFAYHLIARQSPAMECGAKDCFHVLHQFLLSALMRSCQNLTIQESTR